jgi:hypothetical protein
MKALALAAVLAALPTLAHATKLSLGQGINDSLPTVGAMDGHTVYLKKGQDYAVEYKAADDGKSNWIMRSPSGAVLRSWQTGESESYGWEFRAPTTGTYRFEGRSVDTGGHAVAYFLRAAKDCRDRLPTACYLNVGATQNRRADYGYDTDYVRLAGLTAGKSYTVGITTDSGAITAIIQLVNGQGTVLGQGQSIPFKAGTTALYARFDLDNDEGGGPYKLTLK